MDAHLQAQDAGPQLALNLTDRATPRGALSGTFIPNAQKGGSMFKWINTRLRRDTAPRIEVAPPTDSTTQFVASPRRGVTLRPYQVVKFENRQRNRVARAARRVNR